MAGGALKGAFFFAAMTGAAMPPGIAATDRPPSMRQRLAALVASYPETLSGSSGETLRFRDGGPAMAVNDGRRKSFAQKLAHADIEDMLSQVYPAGSCYTTPARNFDPGRIRSGALLKRLYGSTRADVSRHLVSVGWFGTRVRVTRAQGVSTALRAVASDIARLPLEQRRPALKTAGAFNWRDIAGTHRLSVHSFGAAIDLDPAYASYWRWAGKGGIPKQMKRMPMPIVEAFERHGFIWGGRWYHYDTMHFEYRPELLAIAREAGSSACRGK